jgi:hypothetical protein
VVFIPDSVFFRRSVDGRLSAQREREIAARLAEFRQQQDQLLGTLSSGRRSHYTLLMAVCRDIETASGEAESSTGLDLESRLRKLDELMWTYLRLLAVEQTLEVYLETERKERVPELVQSVEFETNLLVKEVEGLKAQTPRPAVLDTKERLLTSRLERLEVLRQRLRRIEQAQANADLVRSEQERLVEQVKLIRADAVAAKNAGALSARIDSSIEHLAATNQWLSELAEFKDLTQNLPDVPVRVGYTPVAAAPAPRREAQK